MCNCTKNIVRGGKASQQKPKSSKLVIGGKTYTPKKRGR